MNIVNVRAQIDEIVKELPDSFEAVDDVFLDKHKAQLDLLKEVTDSQGGLRVASFEDKDIIFMLPSQAWYANYQKRVDKLDPMDANMMLVSNCILFPKVSVFSDFVKRGNFGLVSSLALAILKELKFTTEISVKKI